MPILNRLLYQTVLAVILIMPGSNAAQADSETAAGQPAPLVYHRMYVDAEGVSHFEAGKLDFDFENYAPPANQIAVHALQDVQGAELIFMKSGTFEDWHPAPRRQFAFILRGVVEVTVGDGETRRFPPGSVVLLEDTRGAGHTTRVVSQDDHVALMVPVAGSGRN